uniref:Polycystin-1-like protein 1 n=1 Tax=Rousettus aegyptiacus TaxID=9407 RepID=A0A7J8D874_ROUAE|nr:polycystin 1 like 1, transient receptor potential channel interacting [Rousettus aegyptiacus]
MAPGWTVLAPALALLAVGPLRPAGSSGEAVSVHTNGTVFATDTDITFVAVTKETGPLEFTWYFGDDAPVRTTSRSIRRRLAVPGGYRVVVRAAGAKGSVASEPHRVWAQARVVPSRLAATSSALVNTTVAFQCRINFGTDVAYLWDFGDGTAGLGNSSASHVYTREGELTVQVLAFNRVSSASLQKQLFIVRTPCQPPPVTSLGPRTVQVWRSEPVTLGVAFAAAILCDISQGLAYTWSLRSSAGLGVALPPAVSTHRQTLTIPGYFLEPGHYTALAKVQVRGSVVYANHSVSVEVRARAPVSVISEGTHLLVARRPLATVVLHGSLSYDPDRPGAALRYHWKCTPASSPGRACFAGPPPRSLRAGAPTLSFAADSLSRSYDQFLVTLVVSSEDRNSSEAQVFLSTRLDSALRFVHVAWVRFRALPVNWNDELSLRAACADCGDAAGLAYSWDLFLVNATEGSRAEVDFEAYYSDLEEAAPSGGRWPGTSLRLPGPGPSASADGSHGDGDNLVGPVLPAAGAGPGLLVDWPKALVARAVFRGYTTSGITGQTVTIKPYSLSPGQTYVLQAFVASNHSFLGKAQLYVTVNRGPRDVACQVQPRQGLEAHTTFGVFCTSGAQDLRYEFSYQAGSAPKRTLYRGRDSQRYFMLPAGEPVDGYRVLLSTRVADGEGSRGRPCTVALTVLPRVRGQHCPGEDLYNSALGNLSALQLTGSHTEARAYVAVVARVLSRWATGDGSPACARWSPVRDALVASVCRTAFRDQLSFASARVILEFARTLLAPGPRAGGFVTDRGRVRELLLLLAGLLGATAREPARALGRLREDGVRAISDALSGGLLSSTERQLLVSAGQAAFHARVHVDHRGSEQSLGPVRVHLPAGLAGQRPAGPGMQRPCWVSQLLLFGRGLYPAARAPGQAAVVVTLSLHHCASRRPIRRPRLRTPVTVEFEDQSGLGGGGQETAFVLPRGRVNSHRFAGLSGRPQESLWIRIEFSEPAGRVFPVMLLVRLPEKPTPSDFLVRQTHDGDGRVAHVQVAGASLTDATSGYLSLLDADFDRRPASPCLARAVNYTVHFRAVRCLLWDTGEWASGGPSPQPGTSPDRVSCSYDRLAAFSIATRSLSASFEASDVSAFRRQPENLLPSIFVAVFTILYALLVTKSRRVDRHEKEKTGHVFLHEDTGPGHQLYAVVVDTGFRSPAHCSAKVHVVLCGENGRSGPRELHCPDRALFKSHSRTTFVLSTPAPLGPLRKICLWHDSRGPSPAWYVSRVVVGELPAGPGRSWLFPAECWLAADRQDGRVARELACLRRGLGFWKLLRWRFAELLEDFHVWGSVHSWPSGRGRPLAPRLSVAFAMLCAHACLAALVTAAGPEQLPRAGALGTSLLCSLLAAPGAQLLALLSRCGKEASTPAGAQPRRRLRGMPGEATQAPGGGSEARAAPRWPRVPLPWLRSVAWAACGTVSVACGLGTGLLGYRFDQTQCVQWLCLLTLSVACCVLVTQPLMIGLVALGFAWKRKDDEHFFAASLHEATKDLGAELEGFSRTRRPRSAGCDVPELEEALAARQRARRLRWARPPSAARLRAVRARMRREARRRAALRDICVYTLMLLLHLLMAHGRFSQDECALNQAVRDTFTRRAGGAPGSPGGVDAWWRWSRGALLDGLFPGGPPAGAPGAQPGAVGGTCHLMGSLIIRQLRGAPSHPRELSGPFSALAEDSFSPCCPKVGGPKTPSMTDPEMQGEALSGARGCRPDCELSLGRTRSTALAALAQLRGRRWIDRGTRAVSVHFTLYNPPTRLLTSVSLRAEVRPAGGLALSSLVESVSVFRGDSARGHLHMLLELAFLVLALVLLCSHLCGMADKGVRGHWRKPGNWLELCATGAGLACCAASGHLATLAGEVTDQFHKGFFQEFVDLSHVASWNQGTRRLQGALSLLLTLRCAHLLGTRAAVAPGFSVTCRMLPSILAPGLAGVLLLAAHAHLRSLLLPSQAPPSDTFAAAFPLLLRRLPGGGHGDALAGLSEAGGRATVLLCVTLLVGVSALWSGMLKGSFMTFARKRKPLRSQPLVRLRDVAAHVWGTACVCPGPEGPRPEGPESREAHPPSLDEFACLLDELLLKVTSCSDSPWSPRPEQRPGAPTGARPEDQPLARASADRATGRMVQLSTPQLEPETWVHLGSPTSLSPPSPPSGPVTEPAPHPWR